MLIILEHVPIANCFCSDPIQISKRTKEISLVCCKKNSWRQGVQAYGIDYNVQGFMQTFLAFSNKWLKEGTVQQNKSHKTLVLQILYSSKTNSRAIWRNLYLIIPESRLKNAISCYNQHKKSTKYDAAKLVCLRAIMCNMKGNQKPQKPYAPKAI